MEYSVLVVVVEPILNKDAKKSQGILSLFRVWQPCNILILLHDGRIVALQKNIVFTF